jgi:hypothetical protein
VIYHTAVFPEVKPTPFASETTPWRVVLPSRFSPDGKRKVKYFHYKKDAAAFCEHRYLGANPMEAIDSKKMGSFGI